MQRNVSQPKLLVGIFIWCAASLLARAGEASSSRLTFNVVVENDRGNDITGLTPADFSVEDDAHAMKDIRVTQAAGSSPDSLAILIDTSSPNCLQQAADLISKLPGGMMAAIYDASQLRLLQASTADHAALIRALSGLDGVPSVRSSADKVAPVIEGAEELVSGQRMRPWVALCFALAQANGERPGRKEILFFATEEEQAASENELKTLAVDASRSETSIYVLQSPVMDAGAAAKAKKLIVGKTKTANQPRAEKNAPNALRNLAVETGGVFAAGNGGNALRRAIDDLTSSYEVSYDPGADSVDGRFHVLKVQCSRNGARVRTATGYVAVPAAQAVRLKPFEMDLYAALRSTTSDTAFPLDCAMLQFGSHNKAVKAEVVVQIPSAGLMAQQDEQFTASTVRYSELAVVSDEAGHMVETISQNQAYSGSESGLPDLFTMSRAVTLSAGKYRLQVVARDENSGQISGKVVPFEVTASDAGNALGDIVVVRGADKGKAAGDDPLNYGSARIIPSASGHVALGTDAQMPVLVTVAGRAAQSVSELTLAIQRDSQTIATLPLMGTLDQSGSYRSLVFLEQQSLPPGHYTLLAHAVAANGSFDRRSEIDILAPDAVRGQYGGGQAAAITPVLNLDEPELVTEKEDAQGGPVLDAILQHARERAVSYREGLPDFTCVVNTQQYLAKAALKPDWKVKDEMSEVLRYSNGAEQYRTVEVDGVKTSVAHEKLPGLKLDGEFGELLASVFDPDVHAQFKLKGKARMEGVDVYVVEYSVERAHSNYALATLDGGSRVICSFRGVVYIDANSYVTRSVSLQAMEPPKQAQYTESTLSVNYDYISVNGRQYLLPKRAWVAVRVGRNKLMKNDLQFREYHRFQASSKISF